MYEARINAKAANSQPIEPEPWVEIFALANWIKLANKTAKRITRTKCITLPALSPIPPANTETKLRAKV